MTHSPNSKLRIAPVGSDKSALSGLKRLNGLLLPVNYSEKFYRDISANPLTDGTLTRVAYWDGGLGVVGGVRARWEPPDTTKSSLPFCPDERGRSGGNIYIMTLCTLSPFRRLGVAGELLKHVVTIARSWGVEEVYAHVWECNDEALEWYEKRGFEADTEIINEYYRKLKPAGARIVRLKIKLDGIHDGLRAS